MEAPGGILFDAVLEPNRPLGPRALAAVLCLVGGINFAAGAVFAVHGAWPVVPFLGLDVGLLAWAFHASRRAARVRERVTLTRDRLVIARVLPEGGETAHTLNPYWVRVEVEAPRRGAGALALWSHGKALRIGRFLAPGDRQSLAQALAAALAGLRSAAPGR